jgi:hypothetical protein
MFRHLPCFARSGAMGKLSPHFRAASFLPAAFHNGKLSDVERDGVGVGHPPLLRESESIFIVERKVVSINYK